MATAQTPSADSARSVRAQQGIIFLTLFLDLAGFSLVFPLFPAMLQYYLPEAGHTGWMADTVQWLKGLGTGSSALSVEVLFGGLLGSLYSVLQFFFAPFWGRLSDRVGRRKVLLGTVAGTALSYLLWIFAGQFWLLVLARALGGVMSGNVSVGSAAIADVTTTEKRSSGMALVGIAFGLGFIIGPAMGGILSTVNLLKAYPAGSAFGLNPFSACAMLSFALAIINYFWVLARFPETLPPEKRGLVQAASETEIGFSRIQAIFRPVSTAIRRANLVNLFYTVAFSGMEFTLTFLAAERLGYTPRDMVKMFLFMGFVLLLVQGGMRRQIAKIGEKQAAVFGLACGVLGFLMLAFATSLTLFYAGMAVFSVSSGLASICLPALVSLYSDAQSQGRNLGSSRAAQALGRAIGPLLAALIYFYAGPKASYSFGALALLLPIWLALALPPPQKG